jgi:hypothetical protein
MSKQYNLSKLDRAFVKVYREEALLSQDKKCCYCHDLLTFKSVTAEHKQPRSKNGSDAKENIAGSCRACNEAKGAITDAKFKKLIKSFPSGMNYKIILTWSRRRINLALERFEKGW